jgi:hypothetical protein
MLAQICVEGPERGPQLIFLARLRLDPLELFRGYVAW